MLKKIVRVIASKKFQRMTFYLGIIFVLLSIFLAFDPQPFEKFGYLGVFIFSIFGAGSIIVAAMARESSIFLLALAATMGIGVLDTLQWITGKSGEAVIEPTKKMSRVQKIIEKHGWPVFFLLAMIPWPYDFVSLLAGYLGFSYQKFIVPTLFGNYLRVLIISLVILHFLPK